MPGAPRAAPGQAQADRYGEAGVVAPTGRVAVFAITRAGARLADAVTRAMPEATAYVLPRWRSAAGSGAVPLATSLGDAVARHFAAGESLVVVAAVGVVVRLIAPWLRDKWSDPAVVAVDDAGRYAVCVLAGHLGGGNALTERVAAALGAQAVITTASEAHGLPAVDLLGECWGWRVENRPAVKAVSGALVNGEPVGAVQEAGEVGWWPAGAPALRGYEDVGALAQAGGPGIVVTDRSLPEDVAAGGRWVVLRPRTLALGVGASTGVAAEEIETLARAAVAEAGYAWASVAAVATLDRKLAEPGIVAFAARHGLPLQGYPADALAGVAVPHPSAAVERHVGTRSVCEAAALLLGAGGALVAAKRKSPRATIAVVRRAAGLSAALSAAPGRLP